MIVKRQPPLLELNPVQVFRRYTMYFHGNAIINRANKLAEIAAYTFFIFHSIRIVRFAVLQADGLMRCIFTGDITQAAMNTFILVDLCDMMIIDIEVFPMRDRWHRLTDKIIERFKTFFIHPVIETFTEI